MPAALAAASISHSLFHQVIEEGLDLSSTVSLKCKNSSVIFYRSHRHNF